CLQTKNFPRTF
nr:immunoglobulin light chain junction region [Macaca mulatta]